MKRVLFIIVTLLFTFAVSAQEVATTPPIEAQISALDARLAKSEKRTATLEKLRQILSIKGFIQGEYDWVDSREDLNSTGSSTFRIRRARLSMSGDLYKGAKGAKLDYNLYLDFARIKGSQPSPIVEAWVRYQPFKELGVQMGQFIPPLTFEAAQSSATYEFIDFSYVASAMARVGSEDLTGCSSSGRDTGMQLFGGFVHRNGYSIINYNVAVINGNGINVKDDNKSKDIIGQLTIKPTKELSVALYYQRGEANLSKMENYAEYGWGGNAEYVKTHRWGGGLAYYSDRAFARGEYIGGLTGNLASEGAYIQGGYFFHLPKNAGKIWAGGMVDYFCRTLFDYTHRNTAEAKIDTRYSLCVGYKPIKYFHLQLAYSLNQRIHYTFDNNRHFGNSIKLMATAMF